MNKMATLILYKWRVYCATDSKYEYIWLDETQAEPTTCPVNTAHTITAAQTSIIDTRVPDVVNIKQEDVATGENYMWDTKAFDALPNQISTMTITYPIPVSVIEARFVPADENKGDVWSWVIAPDTTVGALTQNVAVSDTVIHVSSTVTDNIKIGFYANLFDGANTEELGRVVAMDGAAGTITVETASTQAFSAATPTYVRMNIYFLKDVEIGHPWQTIYGEGKIKSSHVPANTPVRVSYDNKSTTVTKRIVCEIELMY